MFHHDHPSPLKQPAACQLLLQAVNLTTFHHVRGSLIKYRDAVWCSTAYAFGNRLATFHHVRGSLIKYLFNSQLVLTVEKFNGAELLSEGIICY